MFRQMSLRAAALLPLLACCGAPTPVSHAPATPPAPRPEDTSMKPSPRAKEQQKLPISKPTLTRLERALVAKHGKAQAVRIRRGLRQVAALWRRGDGTLKELEAFVQAHFVSDPAILADTTKRLEYALEMLDGHANEVDRELSRYQVLDVGPLRPVDGLLAAYSPSAHINEDLFKGKVAFVALLNFPVTTFKQRVGAGSGWTRQQWALARLTSRFEHRFPAAVAQQDERVSAAVETYIDNYNVQLDRLVDERGKRPFRKGLKLISHWGLRDEIRGLYEHGAAALPRQRLIATVMERIIRQEIPAAVINSAALEWDPVKNRVRDPGGDAWREAPREQDVRYHHLLQVFRAKRNLDPHYPDAPTHIDRIFRLEREIPEQRMRKLLEQVVASPVAKQVGQVVAKRLGRPLEPFDIWYTGFRPKSRHAEPELDKITRKRFPSTKAFEKELPRLLGRLGFSKATARFLADHIAVDSARGAGHAMGAQRRDDKAHLRTRVGGKGFNYKGYNIAIHELGHNVEQVFSMSRIDHTLLQGVPNTGFTEAFAFLFQAKDLDLLGLARPDPKQQALRTLDRFWSTYEIAGVALLDMQVWRWIYRNPDASPAQLRVAVQRLARKLWNQYYAPVLGSKDQLLPAIYSHIIAYGLYTPDYPLGKLITFQVERHMEGKNLGQEMERMCRLGRLSPDVWMQQAVGSDLSAEPLLQATRAALKQAR
jgi:hypothetical protein